jgi:isopentenyl phosphate kinase
MRLLLLIVLLGFGRSTLTLVKYGGSLITNKTIFETIDEISLGKATEVLRDFAAGQYVVIVHGAGSFGHFSAKEYGLKTGGRESDWQKGLAITRTSVQKLNRLVTDTHVAVGLPAVSLSLFPSMRTSGEGNLIEGNGEFLDRIADLILLGFLPILHGDVLLDDQNRCTVFSGDSIIKWLATNLPNRLGKEGIKTNTVFLTDVSGVFSHPPDEPHAVLLREIVVQSDGEIVLPNTDSHAHDVTGGIKKKIETARDMAMLNGTVFIVPVEGAAEALRGRLPDNVGTQIGY